MLSTIVNYARNQLYENETVLQPNTVDDIVQSIKSAAAGKRKVRAIGSAHSWTRSFDNDCVIVSMRNFRKLDINTTTKLAIVGVGNTVKETQDALRDKGLILYGTPFSLAAHIGGVLSNCVHSSGQHVFTHYITKFFLVKSDGTTAVIDATTPSAMKAARCGLGMLGIVYEIEVQCHPAFEQLTNVAKYDLTNVPAIVQKLVANENETAPEMDDTLYLYNFVMKDFTAVGVINVKQTEPSLLDTVGSAISNAIQGIEVPGALSSVIGDVVGTFGSTLPLQGIPIIPSSLFVASPSIPLPGHLNVTEAMFRFQRPQYFPNQFEASAFYEYPLSYIESEWAIAIDQWKQVLEDVSTAFQDVHDKQGLEYPSLPILCRHANGIGDSTYLSPARDRETMYVTFLWIPPQSESVIPLATIPRYLPYLDAWVSVVRDKYKARQHWGKMVSTFTYKQIVDAYGQASVNAFVQQVQQYDPVGMFDSPIRRLLVDKVQYKPD